MSEFPNGDEQRETYVNGLLQEKTDNEQHLEAAQDAGKETSEIQAHIRSIDVELKRVGVGTDEAEAKKPVRAPRPTNPPVETR